MNSTDGLYLFRKEIVVEFTKTAEVFFCGPNDGYVEEIQKMGATYVPLEFNRRGTNPVLELALISNYWKIIKRIKPDVVFTYTIKPNSYGGMVCSLLGVPYIANVTGLGTSIENGGIIQKITLLMYKLGLRNAKRVFFQNEYNCRYMLDKNIVHGTYSILPGSGVNLVDNKFEEYPPEEDGIRFLFVGRIMKDKGIEEYLHCAKTIREENPNCSFSIVGDYDDESYRTIIEQYASKGIVRAFGQQKDVHSFMKSHHVLIQPSYHEGLSNVLLEAAACGRPVLASNIPGCRETFEEGISGIGFQPQDREALVQAAKQFMMLTPEQRRSMGLYGRQKVANEFNRQIIINAYLNELSSLKSHP